MNISPCRQSECGRTAETRGYCASHYRRRLHTGRYGYRDATTARAHVARLRELGWTWQAIADAAGLSTYVAHNLHRGTTSRLLFESERALLSVPLRPVESHRGTEATGTRRRVQALGRIGWPATEIAARAGYAPLTLYREIHRGRVSVRLAHRVATLYDTLSRTRGPCKQATTKAAQRGYALPSQWIPETIDNPDAGPLPLTPGAAA